MEKIINDLFMMNHPTNTVFVRVPSHRNKIRRTCASVVVAARKLMKFHTSEQVGIVCGTTQEIN